MPPVRLILVLQNLQQDLGLRRGLNFDVLDEFLRWLDHLFLVPGLPWRPQLGWSGTALFHVWAFRLVVSTRDTSRSPN